MLMSLMLSQGDREIRGDEGKNSGDNQNVSERAKSVGNRQILRFGTPRIGRKGDL